MNFIDPLLKQIFIQFRWARNNTIQLFNIARKANTLHYKSESKVSHTYDFQPIIFQFQCVLTTTDTYYRKLIQHKNINFGIYIQNNKILTKSDLTEMLIAKDLQNQLSQLQKELQTFSGVKAEKYIGDIVTILNHEYLHQGQLIVMFREVGVELPVRFKKAWAL